MTRPAEASAQAECSQGPVPSAAVAVARNTRSGVSALLLQRQLSLRFMGGYWAFPGGAVDAADSLSGGDTISAAALAACRELREETDLIVEATTLLHWAHWITP